MIAILKASRQKAVEASTHQLFDGHLIPCKSASLVGTDDRCTTQGLHRRQPFHDRVPRPQEW